MIKTATQLGLLLAFALSLVALGGSPAVSAASGGDKHLITLKASTLPSGQMAYEMVSHKIKSPDGQERDVTGRYAIGPTVPGPTLVMKEGETAEVTLEHGWRFPNVR